VIDNPQVVRWANEVARPTADRLAGLCRLADVFVAQALSPEVLGPLGITPEILAGEAMPTLEAFPDDQVADGSQGDGRPLGTRRKMLALIRVMYQLKTIKDAEVYSTPRYTEAVALSLAVNPGV
jgi:hypothetical protein